jgi:hypothetical protein
MPVAALDTTLVLVLLASVPVAVAALLVTSLVGIVIHELAHALVGRLLGFRILEVVVGHGRGVRCWVWGDLVLTLHALPFAGYVRWQAFEPRGLRWRLAAAILAGPLSNVAVALLVGVPVVGMLRDAAWHRSIWLLFAGCAASVALVRAVFGFAVATVPPPPGRPTDMAQILQLWRRPPDWAARVCEAGAALAATHDSFATFLRGDGPGMRRWLAQAVPAGLEAGAWASVRALLQLATGDPGAAIGSQRECVAWCEARAVAGGADGTPAAAAAADAAAMVWAARTGLAAYLAELPAGLAEALSLLREVPWADLPPLELAQAQRVQGQVLLAVGEPQAAEPWLAKAWAAAEQPWQRAVTATGLAAVAVARGDRRGARRWLRRAQRLHRDSPLLQSRWAQLRAMAA